MNFVHKWPAGTGGLEQGVDGSAPGRQEGSGEGTDGGEWLLVVLVLASLWWTTLCLGGYRPETMLVTVILNVATFIVWLALAAWRRRGIRPHVAALATLPFLAYAAVNAAWMTPVPWLGWRDWLGWMQMAMVFWVVLHGVRGVRTRETLFWGITALGVVAVLMAAYQRLGDPGWLMLGRRQTTPFLGRSGGPFGIPNSLAALLNLLLPALLALAFQRGAGALQRTFGGYLAAVFACGVLMTVSRGAWLALGVSLAAWPLIALRGPVRRWLWSLGVAAILLSMSSVIYWSVPEAGERIGHLLRERVEVTRVVMWRAGWELFRGSPLTGTGAGSYNVLFERHRPARFWDEPQWAHNDYLNMLSDYGVAGFLLSFGVAAALLWRGRTQLRADTAAAFGRAGKIGRWQALRAGLAIGLLAFALQLFVDFNLKIPALAQTAAVIAALVLSPAATGGSDPGRRGWRLAWIGPVAAAVFLTGLLVRNWLPLYRAEALRYQARQAMDQLTAHPPGAAEARVQLGQAHARLAQAVRIDPANGQTWADLAETMIRRAGDEPGERLELGREAEAAADHALALSPAVAEFWLRRGLAFDLQGRWRDAWADFTRVLALAPRRADFWYYYAYHLSLRDLESARSALATCLALDPWNEPAIALQKRLDSDRR
ncbi:MAG: O-antigen ligase family protein [Opitutaceae bacterium]|nr:O-antigen ligase family protein [Opitutaceae bacterium]